jgi:hypothetical protein
MPPPRPSRRCAARPRVPMSDCRASPARHVPRRRVARRPGLGSVESPREPTLSTQDIRRPSGVGSGPVCSCRSG